jgi:hypothetical protein
MEAQGWEVGGLRTTDLVFLGPALLLSPGSGYGTGGNGESPHPHVDRQMSVCFPNGFPCPG